MAVVVPVGRLHPIELCIEGHAHLAQIVAQQGGGLAHGLGRCRGRMVQSAGLAHPGVRVGVMRVQQAALKTLQQHFEAVAAASVGQVPGQPQGAQAGQFGNRLRFNPGVLQHAQQGELDRLELAARLWHIAVGQMGAGMGHAGTQQQGLLPMDGKVERGRGDHRRMRDENRPLATGLVHDG